MFLREVMEAFADPLVNRLTIQCSAQSAKTLTILVLLCWVIVENPGNLLWVTRNDTEAKRIANMRLWPMLESCPPVAKKLPQAKNLKKTKEAFIPGAYVALCGATDKGALQSTPYRYILGDESRSWPKGALEMVSKRVRSFGHQYKFVLLSTPDEEDDAMDLAYQNGDQRIWYARCRECGDYFKTDWDNLHYEVIRNEEGDYLFDEIAETIRVECPNCKEQYWDHPIDRKWMSRNGKWIPSNPDAPRNEVSFHWGAILPYWALLRDQVVEFLKAKASLSLGEIAALKDHYNETRGLPWSMDYAHRDIDERIEAITEDYDPALDPVPWEEKDPEGAGKRWRRWMGVDVQAKGGLHFYYSARSCCEGGKSRLLEYGTNLMSFAEVADKAEQWGIPGNQVVIDCAYNTAQVYQAHREFGFTPFRGVKRDHFSVKNLKTVYQWSMVDPEIGTSNQGDFRNLVRVLQIAKQGVLTMLDLHVNNEAGEWRIFPGVSRGYKTGITAFERKKRVNQATGVATWEWFDKTGGKGDHFADAECAILAACKATNIL